MRLPITVSLYIAKRFLASLAITYGVFALLILLLDMLELLRRTSGHDVSFFTIASMALLKFPLMGQKAIPFALLFGAILAYTRLNRHQELAVLRAAGVSVWEFLMPSLSAAFALGLIVIIAVNPLSAAMLAKYETMERKYLQGRGSFMAVSQSGLWLRQKHKAEETAEGWGEMIVHAGQVGKAEELQLSDVIMFIFNADGQFTRRIDAVQAKLLDGYWQLKNATVTPASGKPSRYKEYFLETSFTVRNIQDSFAAPETISFWSLGAFIEDLRQSGFSALPHRLYWHATLAGPFFYAAMVLIALLFSLSPPRQNRAGILFTGSIITGFLIYFLANLASSLGLSGGMPVLAAAWAPVASSMLAGAGLLLHLEDG